MGNVYAFIDQLLYYILAQKRVILIGSIVPKIIWETLFVYRWLYWSWSRKPELSIPVPRRLLYSETQSTPLRRFIIFQITSQFHTWTHRSASAGVASRGRERSEHWTAPSDVQKRTQLMRHGIQECADKHAGVMTSKGCCTSHHRQVHAHIILFTLKVSRNV